MDDGTWYRVTTKALELETAKSRVLEWYYEATIKGKNNLPQNTRSFSSIAKSTVKKLEGMRDTSQWKQTYQTACTENKQTCCERRRSNCHQTHHSQKAVTQSTNQLISA
jgi:hypothetical protein